MRRFRPRLGNARPASGREPNPRPGTSRVDHPAARRARRERDGRPISADKGASNHPRRAGGARPLSRAARHAAREAGIRPSLLTARSGSATLEFFRGTPDGAIDRPTGTVQVIHCQERQPKSPVMTATAERPTRRRRSRRRVTRHEAAGIIARSMTASTKRVRDRKTGTGTWMSLRTR